MKKTLCLLIAVLLMASITACHKTQPTNSSPAYTTQVDESAAEPQSANKMTAYRADGSTVILEDCGDGTWKDANGLLYYLGEDGVLRARGAEDLYTELPAANAPDAPIWRQDGERFEAVIVIEGMEETVRYEHIRNEALGFEMDYEYESFVRQRDPVCDRFVSIYDDLEDPKNYLEVQFSADDVNTIAASVSASLSDDYEIIQESYTLDRAGSCIRIDASEVKGGGWMPDQLQMVYIIPAADGCRIATAHYSIEGAEGFGRRLSCMMNTFEIIDRNPSLENPTNYGEQPADTSQWTGRDFGELPPEDFEGWGDEEQPAADTSQWTGRDFGELPPEDFFTGRDYGELSPEEIGG